MGLLVRRGQQGDDEQGHRQEDSGEHNRRMAPAMIVHPHQQQHGAETQDRSGKLPPEQRRGIPVPFLCQRCRAAINHQQPQENQSHGHG